MAALSLQHVQSLCKWSTITLGALCMLVIGIAFVRPGDRMEALIMRNQKQSIPWRIFEVDDIERGVTAPESTHVVFHLPLTMADTHREVLFGHRGKEVRYWGYCFPQNYDPKIAERRQGLPGLLFLSEKERAVREERTPSRAEPSFSPYRLPTKEEIEDPKRDVGTIRHQIETFTAGMMCYVMTEQSLALGPDRDGDALNVQLEREIGTNIEMPDTDGDGVWDGTEYLGHINPLLRDMDSDGLVDGIEDKNWNGKTDRGETDPRAWDSDRDGLCDGFCRVKLGNGQNVFLGEDLNLNGTVDQSETNPLKPDTDGDGMIDYQERLQCLQKPGSVGC